MHSARVVSVRQFGAFCALDGFRKEGLVHISQLAPRRVDVVEDVVREGDQVKVLVLSTDNGRVSCSMKQVDQETGEVLPDGGGGGGGGGGGRHGGGGGGGGYDGSALPELYSCHRVEIAKLEGFGAFCKLPGFRKQGLVHISQVSNTRIEADDLPHILAVGEEVFVKVRQLWGSIPSRVLPLPLCFWMPLLLMPAHACPHLPTPAHACMPLLLTLACLCCSPLHAFAAHACMPLLLAPAPSHSSAR